jgi:hypothetical protein
MMAITIAMPGVRALRQFPEAASLAVLEAALAAVESILQAEHPTVDDVPFDSEHVVPSLLTAHLILSRAAELRDLIHLHSVAVRSALRTASAPDPDDALF